MRRLALALVGALLLPSPLVAQTGEAAPTREAVLESFAKLVDRGAARGMFGLPETTFWRREGGLSLALFADDAQQLEPVLQDVAAPFAAVSGQDIAVVEAAPLAPEVTDVAALAPAADLVIVIGSRLRLYDLAAAGNFNRAMLDQFEYGTWPFVFAFRQDDRRRGIVLLAGDEPERAREAAFILATVWSLGGVTLGPELTGLIADSEEGPVLTPLGAAVFRLFYDDRLAVGMPLPEAMARAAAFPPQ